MGNMNILELAQQVSSYLSKINGIVAIALGGSFARGEAHADSDIDVGIYYNPDHPPSIKSLCELAAELDDSHSTNLITRFGEWGPWINGGGWLKINNCPVDWLYRNNALVAKVIEECKSGQISCFYQPGHPHGFQNYIYLAEIHYCHPLYDPQAVLSSFKEDVKQYPRLLKKAIIEKYLWEAEFSLKTTLKAGKRNDIYYVTGCLFRCIACLIQVLFALNERYFINEKGSIRIADSFGICPNQFMKIVSTVLINPGDNADKLLLSISKLESLLEQVKALTESEI